MIDHAKEKTSTPSLPLSFINSLSSYEISKRQHVDGVREGVEEHHYVAVKQEEEVDKERGKRR